MLAGDNAIILAPTAGGKTEAAVFPVLSQLADHESDRVGALYVAPIKALLNNQTDRLGLYTEMIGLRSFAWHGDTTDYSRRQFLKEPAQLLMTTPESLEVMLLSARVDESKLFADLRTVIIDEIHALAGSDRGAHLMSVIERLARISRHDVQRVGLSATVGNPEAILTWMQGTSGRSGRVVSPPSEPRPRQILVVHRPGLAELSRDAAQVAAGRKSLLFCQSRSTTEAVAEHMRRAGIAVFVHHSAVSREERQLAEERFQEQRVGVGELPEPPDQRVAVSSTPGPPLSGRKAGRLAFVAGPFGAVAQFCGAGQRGVRVGSETCRPSCGGPLLPSEYRQPDSPAIRRN